MNIVASDSLCGIGCPYHSGVNLCSLGGEPSTRLAFPPRGNGWLAALERTSHCKSLVPLNHVGFYVSFRDCIVVEHNGQQWQLSRQVISRAVR